MADLKATAKEQGVSLAEIVRRALTLYLSAQHRSAARKTVATQRLLKTNMAIAPTSPVEPGEPKL